MEPWARPLAPGVQGYVWPTLAPGGSLRAGGRVEEAWRAEGKQGAFSSQVARLTGLLGERASQAAVLLGFFRSLSSNGDGVYRLVSFLTFALRTGSRPPTCSSLFSPTPFHPPGRWARADRHGGWPGGAGQREARAASRGAGTCCAAFSQRLAAASQWSLHGSPRHSGVKFFSLKWFEGSGGA